VFANKGHNAPVSWRSKFGETFGGWDEASTDMADEGFSFAKFVADRLVGWAAELERSPRFGELVFRLVAYRITGAKEISEEVDAALAELIETMDPVEVDIIVLRSVADVMAAVLEKIQLESEKDDSDD
jgi:hypothetical protein